MVTIDTKRSTRLTGTALAESVAATERMREDWLKKQRFVIVRNIRPVRDAVMNGVRTPPVHLNYVRDDALAALAESRDSWITDLTALYHTVGRAFATHTMTDLAPRLAPDLDIDAGEDSLYGTALTAYLTRYTSLRIPRRVDRTLKSIKTHVTDHLTLRSTKAAAADAAGDFEEIDNELYIGDMTLADFIDELGSMFTGMEDLIAELEVVTAANVGTIASAHAFEDATNIRLLHVWAAVNDQHTRVTHADADGQVQKLDDPFNVGDSQLMFPMDDSLGADIGEIIYCRCVETFDQGTTD